MAIAVLAGGGALASAGSVSSSTTTVAVAGYSGGTTSASCPKGKKLVTAGFGTTTNKTVGEVVTEMNPLSATKIRTGAFNLSPLQGRLRATAYCAKTKKTKLTRVVGTVQSAPGAAFTVQTKCPKGTSVRIDGFAVAASAPGIYSTLNSMKLESPRVLVVKASPPPVAVRAGTPRGGTINPGSVSAVAICGKGPKLTKVAKSVPIAQSAKTTATANCPDRKHLAFGGFAGTDAVVGNYLSKLSRSGDRSSSASAFSFNNSSVTSIAYCG